MKESKSERPVGEGIGFRIRPVIIVQFCRHRTSSAARVLNVMKILIKNKINVIFGTLCHSTTFKKRRGKTAIHAA